MRPQLLFVAALSVACAKPSSTSPPQPEPTDANAVPPDPVARRSGRPEVRNGPPGGGEGWISSENIGRLEQAIALVRGAPEDKHFWIAVSGMGHDHGRIPDRLREHIAALANGGDFDHIGAAFVESKALIDAACGRDFDVLMENDNREVAYERLGVTLYDQCQFDRFGIVGRDGMAGHDPFIKVLGFAMLEHLDGLGGPHPTEEALIRVIVGAPAEEVLGEGRIIRMRDVAMPSEGWVEVVSTGYRARWPRPPREEIKPDAILGKTQIIDSVQHDGCLYQVAHHELSSDDGDIRSTAMRIAASGAQPGTVLSQEDTTVAGRPALATLSEITEPSPARAETRVVINGRRFFALLCVYPVGRESPCGQFFDSLAWTASQ